MIFGSSDVAMIETPLVWPRPFDCIKRYTRRQRWCGQAARGNYGVAGRLAFYVILAAVTLLAARTATTVVRAVRAGAHRRREHVLTLELAGRPSPELGVTVVEHPQPAAYAVAGHRRRVVVTTGARGRCRPTSSPRYSHTSGRIPPAATT
jgi:hypothetical protein